MLKHLETLMEAGAEQRMLHKFYEIEPQLVEMRPELEKTFQGIRYLGAKSPSPSNLMRLHYMRLKNTRRRYNGEGIAQYGFDDNVAYFFSNKWLEREILPFEIVKAIISVRQEKVPVGRLVSAISQKLDRIEESLHWPAFWQREKNELAWIATKLMTELRVPACICSHCGRGNGDFDLVRSDLILMGVVWGIGKECLGSGYVLLRAVHEDTGKPCVI